MKNECGCCAAITNLKPVANANRPGLDALHYRIGTHSSWLGAMLARLSSSRLSPLRGLTTRATDDPSIALLDAWATVADILAFYQERIANEGYLRTATERRSVLELARLVGYSLRPGVAASTYLAFTLDKDAHYHIPAGSPARSIPGPGEQMQVFETAETLMARGRWSNLQIRLTQPQTQATIIGSNPARVYLKGIATNLKANDRLLIDFGNSNPLFFLVDTVTTEPERERTLVTLQAVSTKQRVSDALSDWQAAQAAASIKSLIGTKSKPGLVTQLANKLASAKNDDEIQSFLESDFLPKASQLNDAVEVSALQPLIKSIEVFLPTKAGAVVVNTAADRNQILLDALSLSPSTQPAQAAQLKRDLATAFNQQSGQLLSVIGEFNMAAREKLPRALAQAPALLSNNIKVYAMRGQASLLGHQHPGKPKYKKDGDGMLELEEFTPINLRGVWPSTRNLGKIIPLEGANETIKPASYLLIERPNLPFESATPINKKFMVRRVVETNVYELPIFGVTYKINEVTLPENQGWLTSTEIRSASDCDALLHRTLVYTQSEELTLAEEPLPEDVCGQLPLELAEFYEDLEPGRWVMITGERVLPAGITVPASELAMLKAVNHDVKKILPIDGARVLSELPDDRLHTFLTLAENLKYCFKRDTVKIYANVVKATHGETRREVLGSGQASQALQQFTLKQAPLTYVADANPTGALSTLHVFVNDVEWHETDALAALQPQERNFIIKTDDEGKSTIVCGNGKQGARLPTGIENVQARYRSGIGKAGNLKSGQISQLGGGLLGVKEVINPLAATGGADPETRDQARRNAPLAVMALDRLVSARDYADFARTFAGIAKAYAVELPSGLIHLTVAGLDDMQLEPSSDLWRNLRAALRRYGDPQQAFELKLRELKLLVFSANVSIHPDYQWAKVEPRLRAALLNHFSFDRRELGQGATLGEAISVMQRLAGVEYVDVDVFGGVPEKDGEGKVQTPSDISATIVAMTNASPRVTAQPNQLVYFTPAVPETMILQEVKP